MRDASTVQTGKLYDADAYATSFRALVLGTDGCDVVLDRTLFFPEEGGQAPDRGVLGGFPVKNVQIRGGVIVHTLGIPEGGSLPFGAGDTVSGEIDWPFRFSNMQQHSGEHLFSGAVSRLFGFHNVGFHLGESEVTMDYDGEIPPERIPELEQLVNRAVTADVPSVIRCVPQEEGRLLDYRSKLDLPGEVRIVEFPGYDVCACCAPHVKRTGEIGIVVVTGMVRWKGGVRVSILCGDRALRRIQEEHRIVTECARHLTTSADNILSRILGYEEETAALGGRLREAEKKLAEAAAAAVNPEADNVLLFPGSMDGSAARDMVNRLKAEHPGYSAIFLGPEEGVYRFIIGAGGSADARDACGLLKDRFGARGGGNASMAQGSVRASERELREIFLL